MGRTQSRSQSKSSSSRKTIVKTTTVVKATTCHDDESRFIGDYEVRAILARGLTIEIAMQLMNIYNCGIKRLLRIYKCRKTPLDDAVQKAQTYVSRSTKTATQKKPKPPPAEPQEHSDDSAASPEQPPAPPQAAVTPPAADGGSPPNHDQNHD